MNENRQKLVHLHTSGTTEPTAQMLNFGEIAVQHATEESCLYIKDNDGNLIKFIPSGEIKTMVDHVSIDCGFYGLEPEHEYVDLGLPSGTLWATENIKDANGNELYFAWGETQGYTSGQVGTDKNFTWEDYAFGPIDWTDQTNYGTTKYNNDNKTVLDTTDDAATANWGSSWRMPTKEQFDELTANTTTDWTQVDGVNGLLCTSTANANTLFFPAVGGAGNGGVVDVGDYGGYWSVSLDDKNVYAAWKLYFSGDYCAVYNDGRFCGYSVRPVRSSN